MEIKIIATTGKARGQAVEVKAAKFFIGRHENCQLRPDIQGLAGIHALIEHRDLRYYLRDFGAEGGTGINDRVLHARETEIFDADLIQIGPMVLTLSIKPKAEVTQVALHQAPEGWPFLEGLETTDVREVAPVKLKVAPVVPVSVPAQSPSRTAAVTRDEPFLKPRIAPRTSPNPSTQQAAVAELIPTSKLAGPLIPRQAGGKVLACRLIDGVMVVTILPTELNEEETVSPVRYELRGLLEEERMSSRMVIDMGHTRYLSSRAVGVLLAHYQGLERQGATMRVCGVSKEIKPVLDQMRLSMLIDLYPTVEEAVNDPWD